MRLMPDDPLSAVPCHFTLQLTNEQAGAILGVKGANITAIIRMSGAKVSVQSRNEVAEGDLRSLDLQVRARWLCNWHCISIDNWLSR